MSIVGNPRLLGIACLAALCTIGVASAREPLRPCHARDGISPRLEQFLDAQGIDLSDRWVALADLDGDGREEALVYLHGSDWCGSGGCTLLVLQERQGEWHRISQVPVTRLPVRVLERRRHAWRSLQVRVGGGGSPAHDAVLDFDGHRYPANPTTVGTAPSAAGAGRPLIDQSTDGTPRCERGVIGDQWARSGPRRTDHAIRPIAG